VYPRYQVATALLGSASTAWRNSISACRKRFFLKAASPAAMCVSTEADGAAGAADGGGSWAEGPRRVERSKAGRIMRTS